jgi:hypothetical protein
MRKTASKQQQTTFEFLTSVFHEMMLLLSVPINKFINKSVKLSEFLVEETSIAKYITIILFILFIIASILYFYHP